MADSARQSSMLPWFLAAALGAIGALLSLADARAEIILDDFDEAFEIILPEMNNDYVMQTGVGPLSVERWSNVVATSGSKPDGRVDADLSQASALTVEIDQLNPHPVGGPPAVGINLLYAFEQIDITQGGANDRVVVEFAYLQSAIPMHHVSVFIDGRGIGHGGSLFNIPSQAGPFSLEFPFDSTKFDAAHASSLYFFMSPVHFNDPDAIAFSTAVERIRVTSAIPEPAVGAVVCFCAFAVTCSSARKWRLAKKRDSSVGIGP